VTYSPYFAAETVDERASSDDMMGDSSILNQVSGGNVFGGSPARSMVMLWFATLAAYWAVGAFFHGQRS
jgi:hypothetical protein